VPAGEITALLSEAQAEAALLTFAVVCVLLEELDLDEEVAVASLLIELLNVEAAFFSVGLETELTVVHLNVEFVELLPDLLR
jgi:hypothetical protein